ncbi:MAG: hypothetical protein WC125_05130, partial [Bacteroidales bacterium]
PIPRYLSTTRQDRRPRSRNRWSLSVPAFALPYHEPQHFRAQAGKANAGYAFWYLVVNRLELFPSL